MKLGDIFKPLDDSNFNVYHAKSLLITTLGMFTISYNTTFIAVTLPELKKEFGLVAGSPLYVLLGTASFWTAIVGAIIFGVTSNFKGRRAVYGYEALLLSLGSLLGAFTQNVYELILTQMLFGLGIGGDFVMSPKEFLIKFK
ncbi:MAG: MFS transporter [Sulfolobus sp.]